MKHKLESRLPGKISITSDRQMIPPLWQREVKEEGEKVGLKLNGQKTKIMASSSINSSALSFLHSPTLTSIHDYWKNHSLD